jgi:DNA modification methylase
MPDESVQVIVTSPPYWRMRDYGVPGQWGLEDTVEAYIDRLVGLFRELRRVLRKDGTCWVNIGDTYVGGGHGSRGTTSSVVNGDQSKVVDSPEPSRRKTRPEHLLNAQWADEGAWKVPGKSPSNNLKRKDLALVPQRLAIALQDDGWWVRENIIWAKPNGIPEPARGRPVHSHEYIILLAKSERYFYDGFAVRQPFADERHGDPGYAENDDHKRDGELSHFIKPNRLRGPPPLSGANLRSVWNIAMEPFSGDHFAPFPSEIPRRAILAGSSARGACAKCGAPWERVVKAEGGGIGKWTPDYDPGLREGQNDLPYLRGDTSGYHQQSRGFVPGCDCGAEVVPCVILDPFSGSGTTLQVARELGRRSVGFELNPAYHDISEMRPGIGVPDILSYDTSLNRGADEGGIAAGEGTTLRPPSEAAAETVTQRRVFPGVTLYDFG